MNTPFSKSLIKSGILFLFIVFFISPTHAQQVLSPPGDTANYPYWIDMMQDQNVNFFKVQHAFEVYWKDREITKGCGWKPFKRWEYMMSKRVSPTGDRPDPAIDINAYQDYFVRQGHKNIKAGNWIELGPKKIPVSGVGLGRVNAIGFHPTDPNILWVGAASGGLWQSTNGGQYWYSNTDGLPTLGVSSIAVDFVNPDVLYIGTGDRDASDAPGIGVMKSIDGGLNWASSNTGMGNATVGKLLINPLNNNTLYAATSGGIFRSIDAGLNWTLVSGGGNWKDLVFKPGDTLTLYASQNQKLYKTSDGANTWTQLNYGNTSGARGVIGVSPANPSYVYYLVSNAESFKALYRSTDGGNTFTQMSNSPNILATGCTGGTGGQGWYDLCINVDPVDVNKIFVGGVNIWSSSNGGQTWTIVAHWTGSCSVDYVHADIHVFERNPLNSNLYTGCDGGCWYTADNGSNWNFISQGLAILQIYKIGQSKTVSRMVMNGYQDNGSNLLNDTTWTHVNGGDGMECAIDPVNPKYRYATVYYGDVSRIYNNNNNGTIGGNGTNGINEAGAWVSPFLIDNSAPNTMFLGLKNVWRSNNIKNGSIAGITWTKVTTNLSSGDCVALKQSTVDPQILYLVKDSHLFYRTDNAHAITPSWVDLSAQLPNASTPTDISTDPQNIDNVYCTSNHKIYFSTDRGNSWTDISGTLPNVSLNTIICSKSNHSGLYLGTDIGVFYKDDMMTDWIPFTNGLPANGRVTELEIFYDTVNPDNSRIHAATYGRGLWESSLYKTTPVAGFSADHTTMPIGCAINFFDQTNGNPTSWHWSFPGGNPSSSTLPNPSAITYAAAGNYNVQLIVANSLGSDTLNIPVYITISNSLLPLANFNSSDSILCSGTQVIHFFDASAYCPIGWEWSVLPATATFVNGTSANSQNPEIQFNQDGYYSISLNVTNINGSVSLSKTNYIVIGGLNAPFADGFDYPDIKGKGWTIENPDGDWSWVNAVTGGLANSTRSAEAPIFSTNSFGFKDRLISPALNLSNYSNAMLHFRHAYAQYDAAYSDTLFVYASDNCGLSWTKVYTGFEDGSGKFSTHPLLITNFVPLVANDWCGGTFGADCDNVNLSAYAGKKNVKIAFESVSTTSNNIFIDDFLVDDAVGINEITNNNNYRIYPNPSADRFFLEILDNHQTLQLDVLTPLGQKILHKEISGNPGKSVITLDLGKYPKGVYYLMVISPGEKSMQKLFLQ